VLGDAREQRDLLFRESACLSNAVKVQLFSLNERGDKREMHRVRESASRKGIPPRQRTVPTATLNSVEGYYDSEHSSVLTLVVDQLFPQK
jgi:hypothetical protein